MTRNSWEHFELPSFDTWKWLCISQPSIIHQQTVSLKEQTKRSKSSLDSFSWKEKSMTLSSSCLLFKLAWTIPLTSLSNCLLTKYLWLQSYRATRSSRYSRHESRSFNSTERRKKGFENRDRTSHSIREYEHENPIRPHQKVPRPESRRSRVFKASQRLHPTRPNQ